MNWFAIISLKNILLLLIGFLIGRFWKLGKKILGIIKNETETKHNTTT